MEIRILLDEASCCHGHNSPAAATPGLGHPVYIQTHTLELPTVSYEEHDLPGHLRRWYSRHSRSWNVLDQRLGLETSSEKVHVVSSLLA
jgi:hypothetical protein